MAYPNCWLRYLLYCSYRWIKRMWKRKARVDSSCALKELGLGEFIPLRQVREGRITWWCLCCGQKRG